jgi:mycofactocin precursor
MIDEPTTQHPADALDLDDAATEPAVVEDVLVEEVSIDGMCGVY